MKTFLRLMSLVLAAAGVLGGLLVLHGNPTSVEPAFEVPYTELSWAPGSLPLGLLLVFAFLAGLVVAALLATGTISVFAWRARLYRRQLDNARGFATAGVGGQTVLDLPDEDSGPMRLSDSVIGQIDLERREVPMPALDPGIAQLPGDPEMELDRTVVSPLRFPTDEIEIDLEITA